MNKKTYEEGMAVRREVLGADYVDRAMASADQFTRVLYEFVTEWCWGAIWTRPGLTRKTRSLINLAMLTALNRPHEIKLHVRVVMDAWRQWIRHRMANVNEYSTRYSVAIDAAQRTPADKWRLQSADNRQGSAGFLPAHGARRSRRRRRRCRIRPGVRKASGWRRSRAGRKDLPLSTYTEAYGRPTSTTCSTFSSCGWTTTHRKRLQNASVIGEQIVAKWVPLVGKPSPTIAATR